MVYKVVIRHKESGRQLYKKMYETYEKYAHDKYFIRIEQ